ncbi:MAG: flagellar export protein FliJ [Alphaproteobacteria bacterium]|nr:flagellar export protein FliJ [Alphaproteobacteria bacterium]
MKSRKSLVNLRRFHVDECCRRVSDIEVMLSDFERRASDLDQQIEDEQNRVGVADVTHYAYPTFAKAAMHRRDNLLASALDLREQLARANEELADAFEEFKRAELIDEREQESERTFNIACERSGMDELALLLRCRI